MSTSNTIFSGNSRYASDFQQVIERSVAIASLPLAQLNSGQAALNSQATALSSVDTAFTALQNAIAGVETAIKSGTYSASVSTSGVASATVGSSAMEGVYALEVIDLGSYTTLMSMDDLPTVTDPSTGSISSSTTYTLTAGGEEYTVTPGGSSLSSLAAAINSEAGAEVQATVVNLGSTASPDYRLSLRSIGFENLTVQLNDGTRDLLDTLATGTPATYKVNGQPTVPISSDSRTVTLAPGLTATLVGTGSTTITVSRSAAGIGSALSSFASAYNSAVDEIDKHRGESNGVLSGESMLLTLTQSLRNIGSYSTGTEGITSLTSLGLNFSEDGYFVFDTGTFSTATAGNMADLLTFLGTSTSSGFLMSATNTMDGLADSTEGVIQLTIEAVQDQIANQAELISASEERIALLRTSLEAQMAATDALIASMEQQVYYLNGLFASMQVAMETYG